MKNIFVSSTFKDFQNERDILNNVVLPKLNMQANKYGESVSFCDLRWGIDTSRDTEESATRKILSVCMDEIDRAYPYMVILIGDRYGYIPDAALIEDELLSRDIAADSFESLEMSITQLEIEYGLLSKAENKAHVFIYIRTIEDENIPEVYKSESVLHHKKLRQLIDRIKKHSESSIRHYNVGLKDGEPDDLSSFAETVTKDLLSAMESDWEKYKDVSVFEKESMIQWNLIEEKKDKMKLHRDFADGIISRISSDSEKFIALKGVSGSGKSVLFSHICNRMKETEWNVIPILGASTAMASSPDMICDYLIWNMENLAGCPHADFSKEEKAQSLNEKSIHTKKIEYLDSLCQKIPDGAPSVLIAIDALDQLYSNKMEHYNSFLPNTVSNKVCILITAEAQFRIPSHYSTATVNELSDENMEEAIAAIQTNIGKAVAPEIYTVLSEKANSKNLLYLHMSLLRLSFMNKKDFDIIRSRGDGMDEITRRQFEIISALSDNSEELAVQLMRGACEDNRAIMHALSFLAISNNGLRISDLESLLAKDGMLFSPLNFYVFIHRLKDFFIIRRNGNVDFQHKTIRIGILNTIPDPKDFHAKLFSHLRALPETDPLRCTEIINHAYRAEEFSFISPYIANLRINDYLMSVYKLGQNDISAFPKTFHKELNYSFLCRRAASDLYSIITSEGIENIEKIINVISAIDPEKPSDSPLPLAVYWLEFATKFIELPFGETDNELRMLYTVFSCLNVYAQMLHKTLNTPQTKKSLGLTYRSLAKLEIKNTNRDMTHLAIENIRKYTDIIGEILGESKTPRRDEYLEYAQSRQYLMSLLLHSDTPENLSEVIQIGTPLLTLYEALGAPEENSRVHFNIGLAYEMIGGPEAREQAFQHYTKTISLSEEYAEKKKDSVSLTYRILSTVKLGRMCLDVSDFNKAIQVYQVAYQYAVEADNVFHSHQSKEYVLMAQEGIGMALLGLGSEDAKSILYATFLQSLKLLKEYSNPGVQQMCQRISDVLKNL